MADETSTAPSWLTTWPAEQSPSHRAFARSLQQGFAEGGRRIVDITIALSILTILAPLSILLLTTGCLRRPFLRSTPKLGRRFTLFRQSEWQLTDHFLARFFQRLNAEHWPRIWNLLAGHVTLVGPRAVAEHELDLSQPHIRRRFAVKPGLISPWTLRQCANIAYGQETDVDAQYVARRTLLGDAAIVLRWLATLCYGQPRPRASGTLSLFDIPIQNWTMTDAIEQIVKSLDEGPPRQVCFVNADCINLAHRHSNYKSTLQAADWVLADGIGMKLAGRLLGSDIRENLCGTDVFPRLCEALQGTGKSIYLLGARPGVPEAVADWIHQRYPHTRIAGCQHGYYTPAEEPRVIEQIAASGADILLVAFGAPKQDIWIREHLSACGVRVALGVGGLFDYYSGRIPRAPLWIRELGMEWLFRVYQEPGRLWKRYFVGNVVFLLHTFRQKFAMNG